MRTYKIVVNGKCATKGSTTSFVNPQTGRVVTKSANKYLANWERLVALKAVNDGVLPTEGTVLLDIICMLKRPKSHYGRNGEIKPSAPSQEHCITRRRHDIDKLARAILDGLDGIAYTDDSQVVELKIVKRWAAQGIEGASIGIIQTEED